jgi:hypothetical protein
VLPFLTVNLTRQTHICDGISHQLSVRLLCERLLSVLRLDFGLMREFVVAFFSRLARGRLLKNLPRITCLNSLLVEIVLGIIWEGD